jgi:glycosyltransferase involved in cell wall biosynthesis
LSAEVIHLAWLGPTTSSPSWSLGSVHHVQPSPAAVSALMRRAAELPSDAWLFWDEALGRPEEQTVSHVYSRGDLCHGGLALGLAGHPKMLDFVAPTWMLNRDPEPDIEATSWRLTLRACLVHSAVLRSIGPPSDCFKTLEGSGLEFGHRCLTLGAVTRHVPELLAGQSDHPTITLPLEDQLTFILHRYGARWAAWAMFRAVVTGLITLPSAALAWRAVRRTTQKSLGKPLTSHRRPFSEHKSSRRVSVLIPTLDRYPLLRRLLVQLRDQTISPHEIIIVDQTDVSQRREDLYKEFADLPIQVYRLDERGQSSARNFGLRHARGEVVLFLDDDDEVPNTLLEEHLIAIVRSGADASCGAADEPGALIADQPPTPQVSSVFPTNNSLARLESVIDAGGFDTVFDGGQNEDHDLGMRMYLSGRLMMLHPEIRVFHHHASSGGLRAHGSRVITRGSSRTRLLQRHLPSRWELYLAKRYFTPDQVKEMLWMRALTTFSLHGSLPRTLLKILIALVLLPNSWRRMKINERLAERMLRESGGPYKRPAGDAPKGLDRQ